MPLRRRNNKKKINLKGVSFGGKGKGKTSTFSKKSIHKKKSTAQTRAKTWRNKGYNARVKKTNTQVGTSKKSKVKGYGVFVRFG